MGKERENSKKRGPRFSPSSDTCERGGLSVVIFAMHHGERDPVCSKTMRYERLVPEQHKSGQKRSTGSQT